MIRTVLVTVIALVAGVAYASPASAVEAVRDDISRYQPISDRKYQRYLSLYHMTDTERQAIIRGLTVHTNSLSRSPVLRPLFVIYGPPRGKAPPQAILLRVDIRNYRWKAETWEKLAQVNVWFNVDRSKGKDKSYPAARWLPYKSIGFVLAATDSQVPIVRADTFFVQTVVSADRVAGYYEWLGLKNRNDFFVMVGADRKKSDALLKRWAAVILKSGIAINNRIVERESIIDGGLWRTRDAFKPQTGRRNALNTLDDFAHDAEEMIAPLPNGLFAYYLSSVGGVQQDSAPDQVGSDSTTTSNDHRIHAYLSCVRCHGINGGLRNLNDFGRRLFQGKQRLVVVGDQSKLEKLEALYLRPLNRHLKRDIDEYTFTLRDLLGPTANGSDIGTLYTELWDKWHDTEVTLEQAAREVGTVTGNQLRKALQHYATPRSEGGLGRVLPNSLLGFTKDEPSSMLREHWEESFDTVQFILEQTRGVEK